jgi:SAM-dependent methyltransferase
MLNRAFNEDYYTRYYKDRKTRVAEPSYFDSLARFLAGYSELLGFRIRSIVDLGCGIGTLKKPLIKRFPKANYIGVDISPYACEKYGWELGSVSDYTAAQTFDLVVCHDVLQYLGDKDAKAAIKNFANLCSGVLYFSVLTEEDYLENCDKSRTDSTVNLRGADWYRPKLRRYFRNLGGGAYVSREVDVALYALEHLD